MHKQHPKRIHIQNNIKGELHSYTIVKHIVLYKVMEVHLYNYILHRELPKCNLNSLGGRMVMMGLWAGCLPLAMEAVRYTGTPYSERVCRLCDCEEVAGG